MHRDHSGHDHGDHETGEAGQSDMDKMKAELAKLPETDRLAAEKQHMCPVSGEMLGTMGAPLKVTAKGQDVWLCCKGCKDKLLENPDEYLAKLSK
jgi:Cu(I)/Ag(I) efflux system membrane fusion protein